MLEQSIVETKFSLGGFASLSSRRIWRLLERKVVEKVFQYHAMPVIIFADARLRKDHGVERVEKYYLE